MNAREEIYQEIQNNSPVEQKQELIKFLSICKTHEQWMAFTTCHWVRTGKFSYNGERIWTFRNKELLDLLKRA